MWSTGTPGFSLVIAGGPRVGLVPRVLLPPPAGRGESEVVCEMRLFYGTHTTGMWLMKEKQ